MTSDISSEWNLQYLSFSPTRFFLSVPYTGHRHNTLPLVTAPVTQKKGRERWLQMLTQPNLGWGYMRSWEKPARNSGAIPHPKNVPSLPRITTVDGKRAPQKHRRQSRLRHKIYWAPSTICAEYRAKHWKEIQWGFSSYCHWPHEYYTLTEWRSQLLSMHRPV